MKKYILSSVFALLLMFSIVPEASAQEFCALGSYPAGQQLNCYITMVSNDAVVTAEGLPAGLSLAETPGENGKHLSLQGVAMSAGSLSFNISVSEAPGLISCSADIVPAAPSVDIFGGADCSVGDAVQIRVNASVADSGSLSYQWYSGVGFSGTAIEGATGSSYSPDTSLPGSFPYFCRVTNVSNGLVNYTDSEPVYINVAEPNINGIFVQTLPLKLDYALGESLDPAGLSIRVSYDNGSSAILEVGFEASPARFDSPGRQQVVLSYGGFQCSYYVEVAIAENAVEGIGVLTLPDKTEYETGESLDTTGLSIRVYTAGGHFDVSDGFEYSPAKFSQSGRQSVTLRFAGKTCSFTVTVKDDNILNSIDIASLPTRREYTVGDSVDISGLSLQLIYGGRTEIISSGFSYTPKVLTASGTQEITVIYQNFSTSFSITVGEKSLSVSPTPTASAAPSPSPGADVAATVSLAPSATVSPRVERDHEARNVNSLVVAIFVIAIVSLAGLAGYVFYMQKRGRR